ncbi:expressed unknown protein [Seminavis robusta]|uniref:Uncharacterized protein n=1 Tax=Seminavis robusta TaxID=568900 RepID=A0A9N8DM19_9STRA|nr:expressed unknown protein [Seminavis robusta]|eukprot:Sro130_g061931.1  (153) ;mRNA; r:58805-59263
MNTLAFHRGFCTDASHLSSCSPILSKWVIKFSMNIPWLNRHNIAFSASKLANTLLLRPSYQELLNRNTRHSNPLHGLKRMSKTRRGAWEPSVWLMPSQAQQQATHEKRNKSVGRAIENASVGVIDNVDITPACSCILHPSGMIFDRSALWES